MNVEKCRNNNNNKKLYKGETRIMIVNNIKEKTNIKNLHMKKPTTFWLNPDIDMTQIKDSMQIDSGTTIATLKTKNHFISLEVRGEVKVWFNPDKNGEPTNGDYYIYPSEFPQELKDLIAKKTEIYRKDGDNKGIEHTWSLDDRVYMSENNWFEIFKGEDENDTALSADTIDIEGYTPEEILGVMLEYDREE